MKLCYRDFPVSLISTVLLVAACGPAAVEDPGWATDIAPVFAANCARCHTVPAILGAPQGFRLDTYDDWVADDGRVVRGAATMAQAAAARVDQENYPMPPRFGLAGHQIDTVKNWARQGAVHGGPRDGNTAPVMTVLATENVGGVLAIDYEIRDRDRDIVVGELKAGNVTITRELHSGRGRAVWDTGAVANGSYDLTAVLNDGSAEHTASVLTYDVNHGNNVAPSVRIVSPARDTLWSSTATPAENIVVDIADPDAVAGDLILSIEAHQGGDTVTVVAGEPAVVGQNTITWSITDVPEGSYWRLAVTVSDGVNERTVESGPFIIGHRTTTDTFADIAADILGPRCAFCHPGAAIPGLTHDFNAYDAAGDVLGVYDTRGLIYRRAIEERTMPPLPLGGALFGDAAERLENWLLAGAPR